jgi:hypothetical protein
VRIGTTIHSKLASHTLDDGTLPHYKSTLMAELVAVVRNTCHTPSAGGNAPTVDVVTTPNTKQRHTLELIQQIRMQAEARTRTPCQVLVEQDQTHSRVTGHSD